MTNEEYELAVARAEDFLDTLKDTCHDQYDKIKELQNIIDKAIEYIEKYIGNQNYINSNYTEEYDNYFDVKFEVIDNLLNILKGE